MGDELMKTRQSLVLRLKRQEGDAWREFITIYEEAIYRYCRARGLQDADAKDATQEVLSAVHDRVESWDAAASKGSLRAWLFRVARNVSIDAIRRRARQAAASGDTGVAQMLAELPSTDEAQASAFQWEYQRAMFQHVAEQVRPEVREATWQAFWLTAVEGRSAERVASQLNLSVGTVYTAKCRVVARIRERISGLEDEENSMAGPNF